MEHNVFGSLSREAKLWLIATGISALILAVVAILVFLPEKEPQMTTTHPSPETRTEEPTLTEPDKIPVDSEDELRGVYIASVLNINFPSRSGLSEAELKAELDQLVQTSKETGFNTIYFQVRPTGDALYPSEIFPSSRYLVTREGDPLPFDVLSYVIDKAGELGIDVVAWVNPYRITNFTSPDRESALAALSENNPARLHPEWTVFYGGKLYYNPGLPEVRSLIDDGIKELCDKYDLAGILYDDYFYPYPVSGQVFNDQSAYEQYGNGMTLEDWRRENVNRMVRTSFETIKAVDPEMTFGISPFGIWKNASSDPRGSETSGTEAYHALYCDALAWIEGEYVDYIAPQLYWERGYRVADFSTLCRWWSAQVDGTSVKLVISHAAYKAGEFHLGGEEIAQQIQYARNYMNSAGNIQYGFADIANNTAGVGDALKSLYSAPYQEEAIQPELVGIRYGRPVDGLVSTRQAEFVTAASDPKYPVYGESGEKIGRTKSGFFTVRMSLNMGKNTLTFYQNQIPYTLTVTRKAAGSGEMSSVRIDSFTPKSEAVVASGELLPLSVVAPAGSVVTASLAGSTVELKPVSNASGMAAVEYRGSLTVPKVSEGEENVSVGKVEYSLTRGNARDQKTGCEVFVIPESRSLVATVTTDYSYLKISPYSSYYEDYTPASVGMRDRVTGCFDGYWRLGFGGYIAKAQVRISEKESVPTPVLTRVEATADSANVSFHLFLSGAPAIHCDIDGTRITVHLFGGVNATGNQTIFLPEGNFLFQSCRMEADPGELRLIFECKNAENYYGFSHVYHEDGITLSFRQPQALAPGEKCLSGKTVILDAGHGGNDPGALGYWEGYHEKDLNLKITLALAERLEALGANVILTRSQDSALSLNDRMALLNSTVPDLSLSVHHNSTNEANDANQARGCLGLYWAESGRSLAQQVQQSVTEALHIYDCGSRSQELAMCRNHRFPQALVETAFICAPAEFQWATRSDYAEICAAALEEGILNWYRAQEKVLEEGA